MTDDRFVYGISKPTGRMRGFSDEERERIREELVESGRELLVTYGPEKTNVADVTEPVGIAKSTFYRFFDSKTDLYLEVFMRESEDFRERVEAELSGVEDPREGLERLFRCYAEFAEGNLLVQRMITSDNYRELFGDVSPERMEEYQAEGMAAYAPFVERFQEEGSGPLAGMEPSTVLGVMGTIGLLVLHEQEYEQYGEGYYEEVRDALVTSLARGLTAEGSTDAES